MIENKGCRINKIELHSGIYRNIEFYCKPLENLIEIKIILNGKVINIKDDLYGILTFRKAFNLKYYEEWYHKTNYLNPRHSFIEFIISFF